MLAPLTGLLLPAVLIRPRSPSGAGAVISEYDTAIYSSRACLTSGSLAVRLTPVHVYYGNEIYRRGSVRRGLLYLVSHEAAFNCP